MLFLWLVVIACRELYLELRL
eukprot:COSAG02_NODE_5380_length_4381_cov_2.299159_5_plen_20_part_01